MRGRKPVPTALKILRGNPGKRALPTQEPTPAPAPITPPATLKGDALAEWDRIAPLLSAAGLLTQLDPFALTLYCEAYADWSEAKRQIDKFGTVIKGAKGFPVLSPYVGIAAKAWERMRKILIEFGMTPSSRARVTTAEQRPTDADPFAEFVHADLERWQA